MDWRWQHRSQRSHHRRRHRHRSRKRGNPRHPLRCSGSRKPVSRDKENHRKRQSRLPRSAVKAFVQSGGLLMVTQVFISRPFNLIFSEECNNFAALTRKTMMKNRSKWIALVLLIMWAAPLTCNAQAWHSVKLKSQITHPQPMTGLVLWCMSPFL